MLKLGDKNISKLYYGDKVISKAYLGENLVFQADKPKPYYCEVEYLEGTGTQYINTEYMPISSNLKYETHIYTPNMPSAEQDIIGYFISGEISNVLGLYSRYVFLNTKANPTTTGDLNVISKTFTGTQHLYITAELNGDTLTKTLTVNGETTEGTLRAPLSSFSDIKLFTANAGKEKFIGKAYYFKIWENETLVRDFIPVLDWDMKPCMYDKVSNKLYYNEGTGEFTYGRQIHYVEYLESTGTQYILAYDGETDDTFGLKMEFSMEEEIDNYPAGFSTTNNKRFLFWGATRVNGGIWCYGWGTRSTGVTEPNFTLSQYSAGLNNYYTATQNYLNNKKCSFAEDTLYTMSGATDTFTNIDFLLFKSYSTGVKARIKFAILTKGENIIRDFIPAVDENGVGFMFDRATHTIFDNAGTGAFSYPPVELEYLESTGTQYIDTNIKTSSIWNIGAECTDTTALRNLISVGGYGGQYVASDKSGKWGLGPGTTIDVSSTKLTDLTIEFNFESARSEAIITAEGKSLSRADRFPASASLKLWKFMSNTIQGFIGKTYYAKCTDDNGVLVRDLIPALKDGQLGMWDKVNEVFYPNAGTGSFTIGSIVEKR